MPAGRGRGAIYRILNGILYIGDKIVGRLIFNLVSLQLFHSPPSTHHIISIIHAYALLWYTAGD